MPEKETNEIPYFELDPDENTIAYCSTCKVVVYKGDATTQVGNFILRGQVIGHMESFSVEHQVDVVRPRRKYNHIVPAENFIYSPWYATRLRKDN